MLATFFLSFIAICSAVPVQINPKGFGTAKHVMIIGCDGFGGMYLDNATSFLPTFARFETEGAYTYRARDKQPSVSAPNWGTIITSLPPVASGINSNDWVPANSKPPNSTVFQLPPISGEGKIPETMWRVLKTQKPDASVAVSISWDWIHYLAENATVDYLFRGMENDTAVRDAMNGFVKDHKPTMSFIHFDSIDDNGHEHGWGSKEYYDAAKNVDGYIQTFFESLISAGIIQDTLVIVTADHGGWRHEHGLFNEACMYIPALFWGPGVKAGFKDPVYVTDADFAPTALNALGLQPGEFMQGRILEEIYA
eukprot:m.264715 g.264715  ORF g.264715 m.264715 type:complete len:310 (+) comp28163_c0_seq1:70-999(+)